MTTRKTFLQSLGLGIAVALVPKTLFAKTSVPTRRLLASYRAITTRKLKAYYTLEFAQDLTAVYGYEDAPTELLRRIHEECARELGSERGTVTLRKEIMDKTFQPRIYLWFTDDDKHGPEDGWGVTTNTEYDHD
jgi:hypothetical protein